MLYNLELIHGMIHGLVLYRYKLIHDCPLQIHDAQSGAVTGADTVTRTFKLLQTNTFKFGLIQTNTFKLGLIQTNTFKLGLI